MAENNKAFRLIEEEARKRGRRGESIFPIEGSLEDMIYRVRLLTGIRTVKFVAPFHVGCNWKRQPAFVRSLLGWPRGFVGVVGTRGNLRSSGNKDGCGNNDSRKLSERNRRLCHRWRRVKNFVTLGPIRRGFDPQKDRKSTFRNQAGLFLRTIKEEGKGLNERRRDLKATGSWWYPK